MLPKLSRLFGSPFQGASQGSACPPIRGSFPGTSCSSLKATFGCFNCKIPPDKALKTCRTPPKAIRYLIIELVVWRERRPITVVARIEIVIFFVYAANAFSFLSRVWPMPSGHTGSGACTENPAIGYLQTARGSHAGRKAFCDGRSNPRPSEPASVSIPIRAFCVEWVPTSKFKKNCCGTRPSKAR